MSSIISPYLFYGLCVLGALGVALALPRRSRTPQLVGALVAALAGGLLMLAMGLTAGAARAPNLYFYVFSLIAIGAATRVITHPRPVYAALYFILTVLASAGLFLILSAEFMAFALIIVYAGAILITYLFVIMLATQAPEEGNEDVLAEYDTNAREPVAATVVGFVLLAALTTMMFRGVDKLPAPPAAATDRMLRDVPRKVDRVLHARGLIPADETVDQVNVGESGMVVLTRKGPDDDAQVARYTLEKSDWPLELAMSNSELLGFNLLRDHPGTIEIAGVILLMAMLGAVVLSRKQVQLDDEAKARHVTCLARATSARDPARDSPLEPVEPAGVVLGGAHT